MRNVAILLAIAAATSCFADYSPTSARLGNWTISTSEDRWNGVIHNSYPIWKMFDGKEETAWVYSGDIPKQKKSGESSAHHWGGQFAFHLAGRAPIRLDEIRLVNGYNKSPETWRRNNRIAKIAIYEGFSEWMGGEKLVKRVALRDVADWQSVKIPDRPYRAIKIVLEDFVVGADKDVAISEFQLRRHGENVGPRETTVIGSTDGSSCGCGTYWTYAKSDGTRIGDAQGETDEPVYSSDQRYVAGIDTRYGSASAKLWFVDTKTGRFVQKAVYQKGGSWDVEFVRRNVAEFSSSPLILDAMKPPPANFKSKKAVLRL